MKHIWKLLLATISTLTFGSGAIATDRWGWTDLGRMKAWPTAEAVVPIGSLGRYVANSGANITVVPLKVDPEAAKAPGVLAVALPQLQEALDAIQAIVEENPALVTNLKARGFSPDDVVGLSNTPEGITLFVSSVA